MRSSTRILFALFAFLPAIGVLALAVYLSTEVIGGPLEDPSNWVRHGKVAPPLLYAAIGVVGIALLQIALGGFLFAHCAGRKDLSPGQRIGWPLACVFFGSIALPIFFFTKTKPVAGV